MGGDIWTLREIARFLDWLRGPITWTTQGPVHTPRHGALSWRPPEAAVVATKETMFLPIFCGEHVARFPNL